MKNKVLKTLFIILSIGFIVPSIIYMMQNKTVMCFNTYYNFFINDGSFKTLSTIIYLAIFLAMTGIYIIFIKNKGNFNNIKQLLMFVAIVGIIFIFMLPWTSSDIFYYMGVGELNSVYKQNPYYISMADYYEQNEENIQDEILEKGANSYWGDTTVVYGPIAQMIFSIITKISFKNINVCLILFKIVNLLVHILNCYLIYKLTKKIKFSIIYGLNPFIFLEFIGNVHNDIIVIAFILLAIYFLIKKKQILPSVVFLSLATGMKYFAVLLLPIMILYHFRNEEKISKRLLNCIKYGAIFLVLIALEYVIYFKDINVFMAVMAQDSKLSKSIYSAIYITGIRNILNFGTIYSHIRHAVLFAFVIIYVIFCINLLTTRKIVFSKQIRKYNLILILFLLCLTTFQQWYIIWLFAIIVWQKPNMIRNIINLTVVTEIANSVYMFKYENFLFDPIFIYVCVLGFIILQIATSKKLILSLKKMTKFDLL